MNRIFSFPLWWPLTSVLNKLYYSDLMPPNWVLQLLKIEMQWSCYKGINQECAQARNAGMEKSNFCCISLMEPHALAPMMSQLHHRSRMIECAVWWANNQTQTQQITQSDPSALHLCVPVLRINFQTIVSRWNNLHLVKITETYWTKHRPQEGSLREGDDEENNLLIVLLYNNNVCITKTWPVIMNREHST